MVLMVCGERSDGMLDRKAVMAFFGFVEHNLLITSINKWVFPMIGQVLVQTWRALMSRRI